MYCSKCGRQIYDGANFCADCGQKTMDASQDTNNDLAPIDEPVASIGRAACIDISCDHALKKSRRKLFWIIPVVAMVIIFWIFVFYVFTTSFFNAFIKTLNENLAADAPLPTMEAATTTAALLSTTAMTPAPSIEQTDAPMTISSPTLWVTPRPTPTHNTGIKKLELFSDKTIRLRVDQHDISYVRVSGNRDFDIEDIVFISENPEIATIEFEQTALTVYVYFRVTAVSEGTTKVYAQTKDGVVKSGSIIVKISN